MSLQLQFSKTDVISLDYKGRGTSKFAQWVRDNYSVGSYIISTSSIATDGNSASEALTARGYRYVSNRMGDMEAMLVGRNRYYKCFRTLELADEEVVALCDTGI